MKCLDDCHTYELDKVGQGEALELLPPPNICRIHFYEMREDGTKIDGVTNEEVLRVLIHRLHFLNEEWQGGKFFCVENELALIYLKSALSMLEARTENRKARGVEGRMEP